jgi:hypothetical protein
MARRLPPFELRPGESLFVSWPAPGADVDFQLRVDTPTGRLTARVSHPSDLFRRPPSTAVADLIRAEMDEGIRALRARGGRGRRP